MISLDRRLVAAFIIVAMIATALSVLAATGSLLPGDLRITHDLQRTPGGAGIESASELVYAAQFWLFGGAALAAVLSRRFELAVAAALVLVGLLADVGLKDLIQRARPTAAAHVIIREHAPGYGFPSGHSMTAMLFFGYVSAVAWRLLPRAAAAASLVLSVASVLLIGWMRVYNGAHWPSDVFGGWSIGFVLLLAALWLAPRIARRAASRAPA
ncbi:MAG: phosphatase PAP2 family protein [Chloroflexota bacterium]|nr:phosphatase PAP2 family protein [Chloroflexota bacterium]